MITEKDYREYIADFNGACAGTGLTYSGFFDLRRVAHVENVGYDGFNLRARSRLWVQDWKPGSREGGEAVSSISKNWLSTSFRLLDSGGGTGESERR